ncbi:MAG: DUF1566 domain-containing protein, partial [Candidatus Nitrotoga sp.]|nr:DUF1566 domain-containing protein [Candidatus Nitrotoga sp.]
TNVANAGVVTAVFPATTATLPAGYVQTGTSSGSGSIGSSPGWGLAGGGTLIWSKNNSTVASPGYANYAAANAACVAMNTSHALGYNSGWRLPTQQELSGLHNAGTSALSTAGWELDGTWSSTDDGAGDHYGVYLRSGNVFNDYDSHIYYVSCVH